MATKQKGITTLGMPKLIVLFFTAITLGILTIVPALLTKQIFSKGKKLEESTWMDIIAIIGLTAIWLGIAILLSNALGLIIGTAILIVASVIMYFYSKARK